MRIPLIAGTLALACGTSGWAQEFPSPKLALTRTLALDDLPKAPGIGTATPAPEQKETSPAATDYGITGNWAGARDKLCDCHIFFGGFVFLDDAKVLRGGLDTEAWPVSYLLDLHLTADMEGMLGWTGGTAFIDFQSHDQFSNGDAIAGDIQTYDNITAPRFVQVAQLWYKQSFNDTLRLKIGKVDVNSDSAKPGADANDAFSLVEHSSEFLHSAATFSPTIFALPTYPLGSPGVQLYAGTDAYIGAGAFYINQHQTFLKIAGAPENTQASAGGMFFIGEGGLRWKAGDLPGHAGGGAWFHNGRFPRTDGDGTTHAGGGYAFIDQTFFHDEADKGPTRDLGAFLIAGLADRAAAPMDQSLTLGIVASGFVPGRPDDAVGALCSWVHIPAQPGLLHPFEMTTELFYKIQITPWASLKPDFQYIVSPGGMQRDAAIVALRAEVDF
jgi:porin